MGADDAPTILRDSLIGDGAVDDVILRILPQPFVKIGTGNPKIRILGEHRAEFADSPHPGSRFKIKCHSGIGAFGYRPEKRLQIAEAVLGRVAEPGEEKSTLSVGLKREKGKGR